MDQYLQSKIIIDYGNAISKIENASPCQSQNMIVVSIQSLSSAQDSNNKIISSCKKTQKLLMALGLVHFQHLVESDREENWEILMEFFKNLQKFQSSDGRDKDGGLTAFEENMLRNKFIDSLLMRNQRVSSDKIFQELIKTAQKEESFLNSLAKILPEIIIDQCKLNNNQEFRRDLFSSWFIADKNSSTSISIEKLKLLSFSLKKNIIVYKINDLSLETNLLNQQLVEIFTAGDSSKQLPVLQVLWLKSKDIEEFSLLIASNQVSYFSQNQEQVLLLNQRFNLYQSRPQSLNLTSNTLKIAPKQHPAGIGDFSVKPIKQEQQFVPLKKVIGSSFSVRNEQIQPIKIENEKKNNGQFQAGKLLNMMNKLCDLTKENNILLQQSVSAKQTQTIIIEDEEIPLEFERNPSLDILRNNHKNPSLIKQQIRSAQSSPFKSQQTLNSEQKLIEIIKSNKLIKTSSQNFYKRDELSPPNNTIQLLNQKGSINQICSFETLQTTEEQASPSHFKYQSTPLLQQKKKGFASFHQSSSSMQILKENSSKGNVQVTASQLSLKQFAVSPFQQQNPSSILLLNNGKNNSQEQAHKQNQYQKQEINKKIGGQHFQQDYFSCGIRKQQNNQQSEIAKSSNYNLQQLFPQNNISNRTSSFQCNSFQMNSTNESVRNHQLSQIHVTQQNQNTFCLNKAVSHQLKSPINFNSYHQTQKSLISKRDSPQNIGHIRWISHQDILNTEEECQ